MSNELFDKYNFNFKKKFGQNFLKDKNILNSIVSKSNIDKNTLVIEIGVGAAALTECMAPLAKNIIGYEIDTSLKEVLDEKLEKYDNVEIIYNDFLKQKIKDDISKYEYEKIYVVANLPYYITTPIIEKVIRDIPDISKIVIMVQKEVGERFSAKPSSKSYGSLTVFLNYYFDIKKLLDVSRNCFIPKPNVDSIVVEMKRRKKYKAKNEELFFKLVRDSFTHKRKTLRNNLKEYDLEKIEYILKKHNLDLTVRAENINIELFIEISDYLSEE
jgi:16S rRNA (adenine1518-N6/adenine1519-N6)-dimethyltransferase